MFLNHGGWYAVAVLFACCGGLNAQGSWNFAVSGDSRNCGDVVMPAIAKGALQDHAEFYWHLGDFRAIYRIDQDYWQIHPSHRSNPLSIVRYERTAWRDFVTNQLAPFGGTPVYLAFGNHEIIPPKTHKKALAAFKKWLNAPSIRKQRLQDDPHDHVVKAYYHWVQDGIDFITLDNSKGDFSTGQMLWLHSLLQRDAADSGVRALVLGMHEALPESLSKAHSMESTAAGDETGKAVYRSLLDFKNGSGKPVYVLASHSHFYMDGTFNTEYWRAHGGVLPGWIVGTAGAVRYPLPPDAGQAKAAETHVYGYLAGTVTASKDDPVRFAFHKLNEADVPPDVAKRFTPAFVRECWADNPPLSRR